jgi:hypothetical protein
MSFGARLFTLILSLLSLSLSAEAKPKWIVQSDAFARQYAIADGANLPERASAMGFREFDGKALHMEKEANARELVFLKEWEGKISSELEKPRDPDFQLDLRILREQLRLRKSEIYIEEKTGLIFFQPGTRFFLESLLELVNEQSPPERKAAAADRFKIYLNGEGEHPPLLASFRNRTLADELRFTKNRVFPLRAEITQYLSESKAYVQGVRDLLVKSGRSDWQEDFASFQTQAEEYDGFLRSHLLPLARKDFRLPKELYEHTLRKRGIETSPESLIRSARQEYKELYKEFRLMAKEVAKDEHWKNASPHAVIQRLKKRQVVQPEAVKQLFEGANRQLEDILRREHLVTLPATPLRIRVAGEVESLADPIPHLTQPPLVGNTGERPEFVVPSFGSGKAVIDDFSYEAAALILAAHEGRPGHDLQFSAMLDQGTSLIRARYAFNNSNVEGWGLYAEEMVYPYLPAQAKLVALQMRLVRVARAFLDPEVQLGKIAPREVVRFLKSELGLSDRLASLELRRYQYENPGQAPSYFYGLMRMEGAKRRVASALGRKFNDQCFHDGVLSLGMLPVRMIAPELEKNLKCSSKKHWGKSDAESQTRKL